ncbi:MAG: hypothetical protein R3Y39_02100 [Rikenellaceae bacterium]
MKRDKIICAVALTALSLHSIYAEGVDKQVTVTRAYTPTVETATKLTLVPDTSDNSYIKPDIDYSITPISIETSFQNDLYAPTQMSFSEYDRPERFYMKAGAGYPFNTVFDLYASSLKSNKGYIMGYANQDGRFADIENDYGVKSEATQNHMRIGAAGGLYLGSQTLEGSLNYHNDRWSRYATTSNYDTNPLYQDIDFAARYGDNFLDWERFNFAIGADAKYFWSRSDFNSTAIGADAKLGFNLFGGYMLTSLGYHSINGNNDYHDNTFNFNLKYNYVNDRLSVGVGVKYFNDNIGIGLDYDLENNNSFNTDYYTDTNMDYVVPSVNLDYKLNSERIILHFGIDGDIKHNDFATLSSVNPYLTPGLMLPRSTVTYDADFGFKGRVADNRFGYNIYAGYTYVTNNVYWAYYELDSDDYTNNLFVASGSDQHYISINLDLEYQPVSNLLFQLDATYATYTNDDDQIYADGMPDATVGFDILYKAGKLQFGLNTEVMSSRDCSQIANNMLSDITIPTTVNLGLSLDYNHNDKFVIFAEVDNLLNDDIYNWLHYREYGINLTAGVKIEF